MKTIRLALCVAVAAVFVAALPATAHAQEKSRSEGFFLGGAYEGNGVDVEEFDSIESGSGFGVTFGYGFTPNFALYGQWSEASIESEANGPYRLRHFDIGTRVHFRAPAKTVVPFVQAGLTSRAWRFDFSRYRGSDKVEASEFVFSVGGGINAHFNSAIAFTAGLALSTGDGGDLRVDGVPVGLELESLRVTTARVHVGIIWFVQSK